MSSDIYMSSDRTKQICLWMTIYICGRVGRIN